MKSRHLSIVDYLDQLQKEYITADIRSKVSISKNDKEYYKTVMEHKKQKIVDISNRNSLPNIFTNNQTKELLYSSIHRFGLPNYEYRDEYQKTRLSLKDKRNYFNQGSDVKINIGDNILIGKILKSDFTNNVALCSFRGELGDKLISFENIKRIL